MHENMPAGHALGSRLLAAIIAVAAVAGVTTASAASGGSARDAAYSPDDALIAMYRADPQPHWLLDGKLAYRAIVDGKPQMRVFDPDSGKVQAPATVGKPAAPPRVVAQGIFSYSPPVQEVPSPDGAWFAGTQQGNLYVRPVSGDTALRPLTRDGTPTDGYTVLGARWSPDGRYLAVRRMDYKGVPTIPLVDWKAAALPVTRWPYSRAGDPIVGQTLVVADRKSGKARAVHLDGGLVYLHPVSWSADSRYLYLLAMSRLMRQLELIRVETATGAAKVLLDEHSKTNIGGGNSYLFDRGYAPQLSALHYVTILADGRFVWTSERDGWRRLYLYGADARLIRPLTPAREPVKRVVGLDAAHGIVYYVGQAKRGVPYENALFGVRLAGGSPREIAYGPRFSEIRLRQDGRYVAALHGGLDSAPTLDVYSSAGKHLRRLWSAAPMLDRLRTQPPDRVVIEAADGSTDIHALVFKPADLDVHLAYPVVEMIYGGPQDLNVAHWQGDPPYWIGQALASSGFVTVAIDGRGTPERGRDFGAAFYGRIGQGGIAEHASILRQIAAKRPWMDMGRVGVIGHSWGGYFAMRALLRAPDLYKAAVASAGPAGLRDFRVAIEPYMGCLPQQCPDAYDKGSNVALVGNVKGRVLIMQGTVDRDVPFGESMRLIAALEGAGKDYDFVAFPGMPHTIYQSPYWWHRAVNFLHRALGAPGPRPDASDAKPGGD